MTSKIDIQDYDGRYKNAIKNLSTANISERNRTLIEDFERTCFVEEALGKPRRTKLVNSLIVLARDYTRNDFDKVKIDELKEVVKKLEEKENYSAWTKQNYRAILKKFYKWLVYGDGYKNKQGYPKIVSWINASIRKKDKPRVNASDILTENEVDSLIKAAEHLRDKAFIVMLYELGARIGEIGNLRIKDVTRDKYSYIVDISGKTGHRTPRIVMSDPYLTTWLNEHPLRDDLNAPLWVMVGSRKNEAMNYGSLRAMLLRMREKADLKKRIHPHLFRHTRVTHLLINRQINESQAKIYFGWVPSSNMLSEYSHLLSNDVNDAILEIHGIKKVKEGGSELSPKQCARCKKINMKNARFCQYCSSVLDVKTAIELDAKKETAEDIITAIAKDPRKAKILATLISELGQAKKLMEI